MFLRAPLKNSFAAATCPQQSRVLRPELHKGRRTGNTPKNPPQKWKHFTNNNNNKGEWGLEGVNIGASLHSHKVSRGTERGSSGTAPLLAKAALWVRVGERGFRDRAGGQPSSR